MGPQGWSMELVQVVVHGIGVSVMYIPVRNRPTVQSRIPLSHKEQTYGARDFMNGFPRPTRNRFMERGTL